MKILREILIILLTALLFLCYEARSPEIAPEQRVVSLAPSLTEIICAIGAGDLLAGRTSACNYPPEITERVPVVGGFGTPSLETLLAVKPTLILEVDLEDENLGGKIDELGLTRKRIQCKHLDDIPATIVKIGKLLGHETKALELANNIKTELDKLRKETPASNRSLADRPLVYAEIWSDPLMTAGGDSFISELIRLAGGRNIGDEIPEEYFQVSSEWVITRNPEIILYLAHTETESAENILLKRSGWGQISAVKAGRIYGNFDLDIITRPGPRVLEGIGQLRQCLRK